MELEYSGGPKDGDGTGLILGPLPLEFRHDGHRYVLTRDDTGALFYEWRGNAAPAEAAA